MGWWRTNGGGSALTATALLATLSAGCHQATVLNPSPNDALRTRVQELEEQLAAANARNEELRTALAAARPAGGATPLQGTEVTDATPHLASIAIDSTSTVDVGPAAANGTHPAVLRLWISPKDGRRRFLQVVGWLQVQVTCMRMGHEPTTVGSARFGPLAVRDAWRSGFMGTHYAFELPLSLPAECATGMLAVAVKFEDARTGRAFEAESRVRAAPTEAPAEQGPLDGEPEEPGPQVVPSVKPGTP